jgi:hypothetical protein
VGGGRHRLRSVVAAVLAGPLFWLAQAQQMPVVDLTKAAPPGTVSAGVPGAAAGGIVGGERPVSASPTYHLPLELTIRRVRPPDWGARTALEPKSPDFTLELSVKNVGAQPFDLPIGRDQGKVQRPGHVRRRTLVYRIRPEIEKEKLLDLPLLGSVYGSDSAAELMIRIEPQQSVLVLLPVDAAALARIMPKGAAAAEVRVLCQESTLVDDRYFVEKISEKIESANTTKISLPARPGRSSVKPGD